MNELAPMPVIGEEPSPKYSLSPLGIFRRLRDFRHAMVDYWDNAMDTLAPPEDHLPPRGTSALPLAGEVTMVYVDRDPGALSASEDTPEQE